MSDRPSVARMYDYYVGGTHHGAADRAAADEFARQVPGVPVAARANRRFLRHAVERMHAAGVRQFLDLGAGIPATGNVHEVAPDARVVYVDHDPVAVDVGTELVSGLDAVHYLGGDVADAEAVLAAPEVAELIDFARPVGLLAITVFHFLPDPDAGRAMAAYRARMAPGSMAAMTHLGVGEIGTIGDEFLRASAATAVAARTEAQVRALLGDLVPDDDGVVDLSAWCEDGHSERMDIHTLITAPLP